MNRPTGDDGAGLLDALDEITGKLRKEFDDKLDALKDKLLKRIEALEQESREDMEEFKESVRKRLKR